VRTQRCTTSGPAKYAPGLEIDDSSGNAVSEELIVVKHTTEGEAVVSEADAERLGMIVRLMRELDVNLAGVEVILHMREEVVSMQRQFDEVMHSLVDELRKRLAER
jgi:MerR family transcriptional regulator/heat shock protein HspR